MFAPIKRTLPTWISNPIRSLATVSLGPILTCYKNGYFLSCFRLLAVSKDGKPLPWYTYPAIDFLQRRCFAGKRVLEFGGGQSTLWWAERAREVVTMEGDPQWYGKIKDRMPANVDLRLVTMQDRPSNVLAVNTALCSIQQRGGASLYDVIVIDGLYREDMVNVACRYLAPNGVILFDNADSYDIQDRFTNRGMDRIDFYGTAPGVLLPHCTSLYFRGSSFVFDATVPI